MSSIATNTQWIKYKDLDLIKKRSSKNVKWDRRIKKTKIGTKLLAFCGIRTYSFISEESELSFNDLTPKQTTVINHPLK